MSRRFDKKCGSCTGESWEVSIRSGSESIIDNGLYAGMRFSDYVESDDFPLLIKFIDAADKLSVQVHPDEKNELWYIIDAAPDAEIIYGTAEGVSICDIKSAGDDIEKLLNHIRVRTGDIFYIPSGQIHAIGSGILAAEIQQNSDTTYRLYDYGRPRELHRDEALEVIKILSDSEINKLRYSNGISGIANCEYFKITEYLGDTDFNLNNSFSVVIDLEGSGTLICESESYNINSGDTYFLPRGCACTRFIGNAHILEVKAAIAV